MPADWEPPQIQMARSRSPFVSGQLLVLQRRRVRIIAQRIIVQNGLRVATRGATRGAARAQRAVITQGARLQALGLLKRGFARACAYRRDHGRQTPPIGLEIRAITAGGLRILDKIEAVDYDVFKRRPKLDAFDWPLILWRSLVRPADTNR